MGDYIKTALGIIVCILIFDCTLINSEECPPLEDIFPCSCSSWHSIGVYCKGVSNMMQLKDAIVGMKGYKIAKLEVKDSNLGDMPGDIFKGTHIQNIRFWNTKLTSLGDEKNPHFIGLENSLTFLTIMDEKLLTTPLRLSHLKKLEYVYLSNIEITNLGNDWFNDGPENLDFLTISDCGVKEVGSKAFSRLENLIHLELSENNITALTRSALPEKAVLLEEINFSDNGIRDIPKGFFEGMPALRKVDFYNNALTTIHQDTWELILPQLTYIQFEKNPLVCDSKLKWIVNQSEDVEGQCAKPQKLNGRDISSLKLEHLE